MCSYVAVIGLSVRFPRYRGGVVLLNAWHEYVRGTRGSDIVSSATGVLWMSAVRGMRRVGGVCEMCMCLARGGVGGEGVSG